MGVRSRLTIFLLAASSFLLVVAAAVWLVGTTPGQEASGQTPPAPTIASPPPEAASPSPSSPPADGPEDDLAGDALEGVSASARADEPESIPDISVMDVIGHVEEYPVEGGLICEGPIAGDGGRTVWVCSSPEDDARPWYSLVVVGDDPLTIFSVQATIRGATEEQAAVYFSYVGYLCLEATDPLNPEAWVRESIPTGGRTFAKGVELSVYGTREARALQVVASDTF